jgi:kinesin family protein 4/21/27
MFDSHLRRGSLERVTASTDMNKQSSRSHAIFTIYVTHTRATRTEVCMSARCPLSHMH